MLITRISIVSGIKRTIDVPCTQEQYENYTAGMHIQRAMPDVSPELREFVLNGITVEEWDKLYLEDKPAPMIEIIEKDFMKVLHTTDLSLERLARYSFASHIYVEGIRYRKLDTEITVGEEGVSIYVERAD